MLVIVLPFLLVWIGVVVEMPILYYIAIAIPFLIDAFIAGWKAKGKE